ncbi:MAG TPA: hypothetical protein VF817_01615 [Patescibacteria group bacterium]
MSKDQSIEELQHKKLKDFTLNDVSLAFLAMVIVILFVQALLGKIH